MVKDLRQYRARVKKIKIDGQEVNFNDWCYGGLIYNGEQFLLGMIESETNKTILVKPEEDTICRNSFRKDVNGNFVYENDIIKSPGDNDSFFVMVDDGGVLGIAPLNMVRYNEHQGSTLLINNDLAIDIINKSKLVDNVIDQPEWLKKYEDIQQAT